MFFPKPEIFSTGQGSRFTFSDFIELLAACEIWIRIDGKCVLRDRLVVECLWRAIKYDGFYASAREDRAWIGRCLAFHAALLPDSSFESP